MGNLGQMKRYKITLSGGEGVSATVTVDAEGERRARRKALMEGVASQNVKWEGGRRDPNDVKIVKVEKVSTPPDAGRDPG